MKILIQSITTVMLLTATAFAEGGAEGGAGGGTGGGAGGELGIMGSPMFFILLMAVTFFVLIMPQRKKEKQRRAMIAALKTGDEVVSIGGIHGKIVRVKDDTFVLETGAGTQKSFVRIEQSSISRVTKEASAHDSNVTPIPTDEPTEE